LGASLLLIADCRCTIPGIGVRLPVHDTRPSGFLLRRFRDAREVYPSRKYEIFFWDNKATLAIKDTEPNDTGRYRCEVANRLGRIESTGSLHVYSKFHKHLYNK